MSRAAVATLLMAGVFACSTSVVLIRASSVDAVLLSAYRLIVAVLALMPLFLRDLKRHSYTRSHFKRSLVPGAFLGLHFITWIHGARMTPAVNSTLIVNLSPLATPVLLLVLAQERLQRPEWIGSGLALAGVLWLLGADYELNRQYFAGDAVCFTSMVLFSVYFVLGRKNRDFPSIWLYLVPLYAVAAVFCLAASFLGEHPFAKSYPPVELLYIIGLGLFPTVLGHSALNYAVKYFRGQVVSASNLAQPLFAGVMMYLFVGEVPQAAFYPATALILLGAVVALQPKRGARVSVKESS